ncbi:hypothetical protein [Roseovarius sp.]|jgi:hypothetical protein
MLPLVLPFVLLAATMPAVADVAPIVLDDAMRSWLPAALLLLLTWTAVLALTLLRDLRKVPA